MRLKSFSWRSRQSPDGITNETARLKLLETFNMIWKEGRVPQIWKNPCFQSTSMAKTKWNLEVTIRCVVKTVEKNFQQKTWHGENNITRAGRQLGSTEYQTTYFAQAIEDAFPNKNVLFATWIDLKKSFDKVLVWTGGFHVKSLMCWVRG